MELVYKKLHLCSCCGYADVSVKIWCLTVESILWGFYVGCLVPLCQWQAEHSRCPQKRATGYTMYAQPLKSFRRAKRDDARNAMFIAAHIISRYKNSGHWTTLSIIKKVEQNCSPFQLLGTSTGHVVGLVKWLVCCARLRRYRVALLNWNSLAPLTGWLSYPFTWRRIGSCVAR